MNLAAILSIHEKRSVANDYTIRHENRTYQILPPPYPGLRGGKVTVELRADGSLRLRFRDKYLEYRAVEPRRSLAQEGTPAEMAEGRAAAAARPSAGRPGRGRWRPAPDHPWRTRALVEAK